MSGRRKVGRSEKRGSERRIFVKASDGAPHRDNRQTSSRSFKNQIVAESAESDQQSHTKSNTKSQNPTVSKSDEHCIRKPL